MLKLSELAHHSTLSRDDEDAIGAYLSIDQNEDVIKALQSRALNIRKGGSHPRES